MKLISDNPKASITVAINAFVQLTAFVLRYYGVIDLPAEVQVYIFLIISAVTAYFSRVNKEDAKKLEETK